MARAIAWLLAAVAALSAPAADAQSVAGYPAPRFIERYERFTPDGGAPIDLRFLITREAATQTARVVETTHRTLAMLTSWFGPLSPSLTVAGVPWQGRTSTASRPGLMTIPLRLLNPSRDRSMERAVIAAAVSQYWAPGIGAARASPFEESLVTYITARATHHLLEINNFATARFFGGFVPLPLRSVSLSPLLSDPRPRVWAFELEPARDLGDEVRRGVKGLQTLERFAGWPAMLEALSTMRTASGSTDDADMLADALSEVRGTDLRFLVNECFRADAVFDYAVADLQSRAGSAGFAETTLTIVRQGTSVFATRTGSVDRTPIMPLRVRFADGSELRDVFDGAAPSASRVYSATSAAVSATVDPEVMLLLDVNRENNAIVRDARIAPLGIRLALNWMAWLQNTMLSYTAIL